MDKPEEAQRRQFLLIVNLKFDIFLKISSSLILKAIQFYEEKIRNEKESLQIAQYYINIGHWHLLLEDFPKGSFIRKTSYHYY